MHKMFCVAASLLGVALVAKPAAAIQPVFFFNSHTSMCLQPVNESTAQGAAIVQEPCNVSVAQEWLYISVGSAGFHFENALSGLCLDARGGASNGTPVQQWPCNEISNENWQPLSGPKGESIGAVISRVSGSSSHCLDVPEGQQTAGLAMQIFHCNGSVSQIWQLKPDGALVVPNVLKLSETVATNEVSLFDLTPVVSYSNKCIAPGSVIGESPNPGSQQVPKASVYLTVDNGTNCAKK